MPMQEQSSEANTSGQTAAAKPQRVLACLLCQQRKVKCDRKSPCTNCVKAGAQCVPAALIPRQRRRRFPERELLQRLRHYEDLLRQNNIKFEPMHSSAIQQSTSKRENTSSNSPDSEYTRPSTAGSSRVSKGKTGVKSERISENRNSQGVLNQTSLDSDDDNYDDDGGENDDYDENDSNFPPVYVREDEFRKAWDQFYESNVNLLFGSRKTNVDLSTFHPQQVDIFRLWQIYLDNVNPLLKVTHTPTLQARILDAAGAAVNLNPVLEALMFSIYCNAIASLTDDECSSLFGSSKADLLIGYRFGCEQALLNCGVLRCDDRDCLTALFLYLVSLRPDTDPRSLSSMLGVAVRLAQRIGIQNESNNAKCNPLEAEMRRRLWWALVVFDNRICELSIYKCSVVPNTWDCKPPSNVNDFDFRPEMTTPPAVHGTPTEALFVVVRSEVGQFIRRSTFRLPSTNPSLMQVSKDSSCNAFPEGGEADAWDKEMEEKYFQFCNLENPLHFMTFWTAKGYVAKGRLMEHHVRFPRMSVPQADTEREAGISHALTVLKCDTKLMRSPLTKGFFWLLAFHFPFPAYMHIVHDLQKRPSRDQIEDIWEVMSENFESRFDVSPPEETPFLKVFSGFVLQAWDSCEAASNQLGTPLRTPRIVLAMRHHLAQIASSEQTPSEQQTDSTGPMSLDEFSMLMPMDFGGQDLPFNMGEQIYGQQISMPHGNLNGPPSMNVSMNRGDWATIDWNSMYPRGW